MQYRKNILILPLTLLLSGCTVLKNPESSISDQKTKAPDNSRQVNIESQLLTAAQSIETSLKTLAAAQNAESPPILNTAPLLTSEGGMGGYVDVDWTGPIGPLAEKLATLSHYRVKFLGAEPPIPVLVTINVKQTPIADVLQNASLQAGKRAHILVFPSNRLIEIRYLAS